ncbi:MAG: fibronectin type III domain-containing protein [Xanthomonadales bacterium]|nr:fibronectin type III domain-containing protein [Xanthomonadales bacterium]
MNQVGSMKYVLWPLLAVFSLAAQATVDVVPSQGQPAGAVSVTANALARSADYAITLTSRTTGSFVLADPVSTDPDGRFSTLATLPDAPAGDYDLVVTGALGVAARIPFTMTGPLSLDVTPRSAFAGEEIELSLAGMKGNRLEIRLDGQILLGPLDFDGSMLGDIVTVPFLDLGGTAALELEATTYQGSLIAGRATAVLDYQEHPKEQVSLTDVVLPSEPIVIGQPFTVSGRVVVPAGQDAADFVGQIAWKAGDGTNMPVNPTPIYLNANGGFVAELFSPNVLSGFPSADSGGTEDPTLEFIYNNPATGESGTIIVGTVGDYSVAQQNNFNGFQTINMRVRNILDVGIEDAIVIVGAEVVPSVNNQAPIAGYDPYQEFVDDFVTAQAAASGVVGFNQISQSFSEYFETNELSGCPVTLRNGLTDAQGRFSYTLDLNTTVAEIFHQASLIGYKIGAVSHPTVVPEYLRFAVSVSAAHLNYADVSSSGDCKVRRFAMQYSYDNNDWNYLDPVNLTFSIPFDPDDEQLITLAVCDDEAEFLAPPQIPGLLPAFKVRNGDFDYWEINGLVSYPDRNGANLVFNEVPRIELPYSPGLLGQVQNVQLVLQGPNGLYVRPMPPNIGGQVCSASTIHYSAEIPELVDWPAGSYFGTITGQQVFDGEPRKLDLQINITAGPSWIGDDQILENRVIRWSPKKQTLSADEIPLFTDDASTPALPLGIPPLQNDNLAIAMLTETRTPEGSAGRKRSFGTATTAANTDADNVMGVETIPQGLVPIGGSATKGGDPCGNQKVINILDTGQFPLFLYVIGAPPLIDLTLGVTIGFFANLAYGGCMEFTDFRPSINLNTEANAGAEVVIFLDATIMVGLVKATAEAISTFALGMVFELQNSLPTQVGPCFTFDLDARVEASLGPCPFCLKVSETISLIDDIQEGVGCTVNKAREMLTGRVIPEPPVVGRIALAADGLGRSATAFARGDGDFQVNLLQAGQQFNSAVLGTGPGAMHPEIAYYAPGKFVLAWAESRLNESDFETLRLAGDMVSGVAEQRIMYRVFDQNGFSDPMVLSDLGGEGGLRMAACMQGNSACPASGEVLATWEVSVNEDYTRHDYRIMTARFDGMGWSPVEELDSTSTAKDSQPSPVYLFGQPVVVWVRNPAITFEEDDLDDDGQPDGISMNVDQRRMFYRFLDESAGPLEVMEAPLGLASPFATPTPDGGLLVAFSLPEPGQNPYLGSRRMLRYARATQCIAGSCQWADMPYTDSIGRNVYVERPRVMVDGLNNVTTVFRQLGVSGEVLPTDPPEVILGVGGASFNTFELPEFSLPVSSDPLAISADGVADVYVNAVMEPLSNSLMTAAATFNAAPAAQFQKMGLKTRSVPGVTLKGMGDEVNMMIKPNLPDLEILDATPSAGFILEGGQIDVTVRVRNAGPRTLDPVSVVAEWDAGRGRMIMADQIDLPGMISGMPEEVILQVELPPEFSEDQTRDLVISVNPNQAISEATVANNRFVVTLGELEAPTGLVASTTPAGGSIFLGWEAAEDPRITGYRVYRQTGGEPPLSAGFSTVAGFADLEVIPGTEYDYWVVSISNGLQESAPTDIIPIRSAQRDRLFRDSFETP